MFAPAVATALSIAVSTMTLPAFCRHARHTGRRAGPDRATRRARSSSCAVRQKLFNPDGIVVTQNYVFVDWQGQSTICPAPSTDRQIRSPWKLVGRLPSRAAANGLRLNPATNCCGRRSTNAGLNGKPKRQPLLYTIDAKTLTTKLVTFPAIQPHGGGYDDLAFINGIGVLAASNADTQTRRASTTSRSSLGHTDRIPVP